MAVVESQRQGSHISRHDPLAGAHANHPGLATNRTEAQDRALPRVDDRRTSINPKDTDIGDREGATSHVGWLSAACSSGLHQGVERSAELSQVKPIGVFDVGYDEPARRGSGDAQVYIALGHDLFGSVVPGRVDHGSTPQRQHAGPSQEHQRSHLRAAELWVLLDRLDEFHASGDIDGDPFGHVGCAEGRGDHRVGHCLAQSLDRLTSLARMPTACLG